MLSIEYTCVLTYQILYTILIFNRNLIFIFFEQIHQICLTISDSTLPKQNSKSKVPKTLSTFVTLHRWSRTLQDASRIKLCPIKHTMKSFSRCVRHWRSIAIHHWKIHNKTVHGFLSAYSFIGHTTLSSFDRRLLFYFISSFSSISASHCVHLSSSQKHYVCEEHLLCVHLLVVLTRQANLPMLLLLVLVFRSSLPHRVDFFETKPAPVRLGPGRTLRFYDRPRVALVLYDV